MNLLFGVILSSYDIFNIVVSSTVIVATGVLLYVADSIHLKDGFKVSLMLLFAMVGVIEFILSLIATNHFTDNWWLILAIGLMAAEIILLIITNSISNKINQ